MTYIKINETVGQIESMMNAAVARVVDAAIKKALPRIRERVVNITPPIWKDTATYRSLIDGPLNSQFGFHKGTAKRKVNAIIRKAAESFLIEYEPMRLHSRSFRCTIGIYILKRDLYEVLDMYEGIIVTEKDYLLHWTDWLLTQGNKIIINRYSYLHRTGKGRSEGGLMRKGGKWRVPPEHSGVLGNNWLTRSLEQDIDLISEKYSKVIGQEIRKSIDGT